MIRLNYFPIPDFQNAINGDYEYTCEQPAKWSPYNCNLQMGAIKVGRSKTKHWYISFYPDQVITEDPTPDKVAEKLTGGVEDTLLLINMMKDFKMRELKKAKVSEIVAIIPTQSLYVL